MSRKPYSGPKRSSAYRVHKPWISQVARKKLRSWLTKKPRPLGQSGTGSRKGTAWGKRWRHRSELQNSGSCRAPPADFCTIRDVYDVGIPMVLLLLFNMFKQLVGRVWNLGSQTQFPNHVQWWSKRKIQLSPVKIIPNLDSDHHRSSTKQARSAKWAMFGAWWSEDVACCTKPCSTKWQRMAAKVLSSVKQTAISHLYPPIATFQTCHQLPLSFQLLFDSDITDLPYTSRPGNSMELVSTRVSTKPFAAIPAAKSDVGGTPLKSICCSNSCHEMAIDRSVF